MRDRRVLSAQHLIDILIELIEPNQREAELEASYFGFEWRVLLAAMEREFERTHEFERARELERALEALYYSKCVWVDPGHLKCQPAFNRRDRELGARKEGGLISFVVVVSEPVGKILLKASSWISETSRLLPLALAICRQQPHRREPVGYRYHRARSHISQAGIIFP